MLYSDKVMDHFEHPRNVGEIANADGVGQVDLPAPLMPTMPKMSPSRMVRLMSSRA